MTVTDTEDVRNRLYSLFSYLLAMQGNVFQMPQAHSIWAAHTLGVLEYTRGNAIACGRLV